MNRKGHIGLLLLVLIASLVVMVGSAAAQRPGGGGARPTRPGSQQGGDGSLALTLTALPNGGDLATTLTALPNGGDLAATLTAFPTPAAVGTLSSLLTATPAAVGTLSAVLTNVPQGTHTPLTSSAEAAAVMDDFGSLYLGFSPAYLYAGEQNGNSADLPENAMTVMTAMFAQLPADVQTYLTNFGDGSGLVYGGVYQNGSSVLAVANCDVNPNCAVTADSIQIYLTNSAAGIYALYANTGAASAADALNLLISLYPKLGSVGLTAVATESGYAFEATQVSSGVQDQAVQATGIVYYAGVIPSGNLSLTYALVGVGSGYTELNW